MENKRIVRIIFGFLLLSIFIGVLLWKTANGSVSLSEPTPSQEATAAPVLETPAAATAEPPLATEAPPPPPTDPPAPESDLPDVDLASWELVLVNQENNIGEYIPELSPAENGQQFDTRALGALENFIAAAREQGLSVVLSSTYRDYATQRYLYDRKVSEYGAETAKTIVSPPGTSEHQLGLAADITDQYYEYKNASLAETALYKWMSANCAEYGFIVRYPQDKTEITGVMFEPWHFRYVGVEAAKYIMEKGICLEEFIALYS